MSDSLPTAPETPIVTPAPAPAPAKVPFFSGRDKLAFWIAGLITFAGYVYTLAPSVTLEDAGEFLPAARHLGVPHPPGYPIWTILAWLWQMIIPIGNVAWRVNLMSAFFGAFAIGLTALLISKTGHVMGARVGFLTKLGNERLVNLIVLVSSVSPALMLAFTPVMWSQSVITEVYALNAWFLMVTLHLLYRWSFEPDRRWRLYLAAFVWGVSLTNHQTLVLLTFAFPAFVWLIDRDVGRDLLLPMLAIVLLGVLRMIVSKDSMFHQGPFSGAVVLFVGIGAGVWLMQLVKQGGQIMRHWRVALILYGAVLLGLSLYLYMPLSSATNPPMNWGYTQTPEGFLHHFTRGQYEKVRTERTLFVGDHAFWGQISMFTSDVEMQYNLLFLLLPLLALYFYNDMDKHDRKWMIFLLFAYLSLSLGFIFLSNPTFEKQKQFTDRVFFLPGHCLFALWIGYGLILGLGYLFLIRPAWQKAGPLIATVVFLLPAISYKRNWANNEQGGHDFGYRFGYLMFKPGGGYPDMDKDAVLYGGTDPGRFVPTHMIFVESLAPESAKTDMEKFPGSGTFDRRDVYIITQNALADSTYMNYIRDHYGLERPDLNNAATITNRQPWRQFMFKFGWDYMGRNEAYPKKPIWIPTEQDTQRAFSQYVDELQRRPQMPGEQVSMEGGRVSVQGVQGVMAINGILTKMIFDNNKDKHSFYVEESYVIPWMYPYMEPYGIILKINKDPLPGPEQDPELWKKIVARDTKYWDSLYKELMNDPRFKRDDIAQKTFSKLRSAIGGLYAARKLVDDAEHAFKQSASLCPDSPEANFRLAQLYNEVGRNDEAVAVLENYQQYDPHNSKIADAVRALKEMGRANLDMQQLEQQFGKDPANIGVAMRLFEAYANRMRMDAMDAIANSLLVRTNFPPNEFLRMTQKYAQLNRLDRAGELLTLYTQRFPQDPTGWYNLARLLSLRNNCTGAAAALSRALAFDNPAQQIRVTASQDPFFNHCRTNAQLQTLLGTPAPSAPPSGAPPPP